MICNNILEIRGGGTWGYKEIIHLIKQKELFLQTLDDRILKMKRKLRELLVHYNL